MDQPSLFGDCDHLLRPPPPSALPDPAVVRGKLLAVLDRLRQPTSEPPFAEREMRYWCLVFPQMSNWLPEAERAELRAAFQAEIARLETRAAA